MPRAINKKCQACAAKKTHEEAMKRNCWVAKTCVARRSHYRNRAARLAKKQAGYVRGRVRDVAGVDLPLQNYQAPPLAQIVYWRDAQDKPVHAIAVQIYQDGKLIDQANPVHCSGISGSHLKRNLRHWMGVLAARNVGLKAGADIQQPVALCPICQEVVDGQR